MKGDLMTQMFEEYGIKVVDCTEGHMNILDEANKLTNHDRQDIYGHPADDFAKIAIMTAPILASDIDPRLKHALYMVQVKVARLLNTPQHIDSIIDLAGYANTYNMIIEKMKSEK